MIHFFIISNYGAQTMFSHSENKFNYHNSPLEYHSAQESYASFNEFQQCCNLIKALEENKQDDFVSIKESLNYSMEKKLKIFHDGVLYNPFVFPENQPIKKLQTMSLADIGLNIYGVERWSEYRQLLESIQKDKPVEFEYLEKIIRWGDTELDKFKNKKLEDLGAQVELMKLSQKKPK